MNESPPDFVHSADMGFTRAELIKGLRTAVVPYQVDGENGDAIEISGEGRRVKLTTGADGYRAIASMRVPQLAVRLEFYGFDQSSHEAFMTRFKRYLHKGGG